MSICLLFDSDGTLVDSETINMRAFADELALHQIDEQAGSLLQTYRGWRLKSVLQDISDRHSVELDTEFENDFRARASEYFERDLQPIRNVRAALDKLSMVKCVASNAPMAKLCQVLKKTELMQYFNGNLFSAYDISKFKPDPGLFLHAAKAMGFEPDNCIVVEDSLVGLQAGITANMKCIFYNPASIDSGVIKGMQSTPDVISISDMLELPDAVQSFN